jgi:hypothetical protein
VSPAARPKLAVERGRSSASPGEDSAPRCGAPRVGREFSGEQDGAQIWASPTPPGAPQRHVCIIAYTRGYEIITLNPCGLRDGVVAEVVMEREGLAAI